MAWRLNRSLTNWRAAVDRAYPNRDRASDGTIGDRAHQQTSSDHNPDADGTVDAWDMDVNLRSPDDRAAIEALKRVFQAHPAARYWIHARQIAHRSDGWVRRPYTGANPHDKHVHWNSNQATENSTAPWVIEEAEMANFEARHATAIDYMDGRIEAMAHGRDVVRTGLTGAGQQVWVVQELRRHATQLAEIRKAQAADETRARATLVALEQLASLVRAGGGDVDTGAILAAIAAAGEATTAAVAALQEQLAAAEAERDQLAARLAEALAPAASAPQG